MKRNIHQLHTAPIQKKFHVKERTMAKDQVLNLEIEMSRQFCGRTELFLVGLFFNTKFTDTNSFLCEYRLLVQFRKMSTLTTVDTFCDILKMFVLCTYLVLWATSKRAAIRFRTL